MKRFYLFLGIQILGLNFFWSQKTATSLDLVHLNDSNLRKIQKLLINQNQEIFIWDRTTGEKKRQTIIINEYLKSIEISIMPILVSKDNWTIRYKIPIMEVDNVTQDYENSTINFETANNEVEIWEDEFIAGFTDKVSIHCNLKNIRNLAGQLLDQIKNYPKATSKV